MTNQSDRRPTGSSREARTTMICDGALETLKLSLDAFLLSIRSQAQTVGAMRRLNERGLRSAQEVQALEATINQLIVGQLLQGAAAGKANGGPMVPSNSID